MKRVVYYSILALVVSSALVMALTGCAAPKGEEKGKLPSDLIMLHRGATGGVGPIMIALAELTTKYTPMQATAQETAGSKTGVMMLDEGKADFLNSNSATLRDAYWGIGEFDKPAKVMASGAISPNVFAIQARGGTGIKKMEDLKGKKIMCVLPPQPWLTSVAKGLLEFYGIKWTDIEALQSTGAPEYHKSAMLERRADAFIGVSNGAYRIEIAKSVGLVNVPVSREAIEHVKKSYEPTVYYTALAPRLLSDIDMDPKVEVGVIGIMTHLVVRTDLPDEAVYLAVKALYDHYDEMVKYGKVTEETTLKLAVSDFPIPVHAGAIKYFKEKGVWTAEHQKIQDALLAKPKGK